MPFAFRAYAIALAAVGVAVFGRWLLDPVLGGSFPLVTLFGAVAAAAWLEGYRPALLATFAGYLACTFLFIAPREAVSFSASRDLVGLAAYLLTCAIIIALAEAARRNRLALSRELTATHKLHEISGRLLLTADAETLYQEILDTAAFIMRSEYASLQMLSDGPRENAQLRLLAARGFSQEARQFWQFVTADSQSTCGVALRTGQRVIAPDVERAEFLAGSEDLATYRQTGIRAVQTTPLTSRGGELVGMISTHWRNPYDPPAQDLRLLDMLVRQAADLLERTAAAEALRASEQRLRDADRRKNEFLALLAHELRNPLAPIRNSLGVLAVAGGNRNSADGARKMIGRQVDLMVRLIDDLLDVNRITRGTLELRRERLELNSVIHNAVASCRPQFNRAEQDIAVAVPPEPVYLSADPARLSQILCNVLGNASKFTPRGGKITLTARRHDDRATISVKDNGIGIPKDQLERIFEMFSQIKTPLEEPFGGLGIGLALVKRLVELHGGTVLARSDGPGTGSEFVITLPVLAGANARQAHRAPEPAKAVPRRRVLVVDDNHDGAESLAMLLQLTGHETRIVYDGENALVEAARFHPDFILLDLGLPKLNGYDVCARIRAQGTDSAPTIIAMTGWSHDDARSRARESGFDGYLIKPVEERELARTLESPRRAG